MSRLWDSFLSLDPRLAAALVAAVVSVLTTIVTVLLTPVGAYLVDKRRLRDKLRTEYEYEQRKKLRDLIGQYHGRVLQAAEELNYRFWNLYEYQDKDEPWILQVNNDYREAGTNPDYYYFQTMVYRFLALFAVVRRFETEALYIDSRIAGKIDFTFVLYLRAFFWVATDVQLFERLNYDPEFSTDHFFRDQLRRVCDYCWVQQEEGEDRLIYFDELREKMGKEDALDPALDFFNNLHRKEGRYRWDRIVALHLILISFINDFGHHFQIQSGDRMKIVAGKFDTDEVPQNLHTYLSSRGGLPQETTRKIQEATEAL